MSVWLVVCVSVCVFWSEAKASTTSGGLASCLRPLMQAFSVLQSSWQPIYTEAKHSNTHRRANRGSLRCQNRCVCVCVCPSVLISNWASCSAHNRPQTLLILRLCCIQRAPVCVLVLAWIYLRVSGIVFTGDCVALTVCCHRAKL